MRSSFRTPLTILLLVILLNIVAVSATILLHEGGHFITGINAQCKNIKLVLFDSELGTYTQMACPAEQPIYFAIMGALLLTTPFALSFMLLKGWPEKRFFWICIGFNLLVSLADIGFAMALQIFSLVAGAILIIIGEVLLIDELITLSIGPASGQ